jgi:predicted AAA-ATPase/PD-(D/E)XK nuclease superfamily protein
METFFSRRYSSSMHREKKILPVGLSDFKQLIEGDFAYVDKSLLIQELMERGGHAALIPRPRRFGKTLNLSMLRYFFEKSEQDHSYLFRHLKIWQNEKMRALQGQFPVIFITFKGVKYETWEKTWSALKRLIAAAFNDHAYLLKDSVLNDSEKKQYQTIASEEDHPTLYDSSLELLTTWLCRYHKKRVILLIDEYDAPAHASYRYGYYDELILFLRNWLTGGFKDNRSLEKGVLTGILRIAKESIFSGLNNVKTFTLLNNGFEDKFGLTEAEVKALLKEYDLSDKWDLIRKWYNGYRIASYEGIFNPWSVINCIVEKGTVSTYWVNTSSNELIEQLLIEGKENIKADFESLMNGETIAKTIEDGIVFPDLKNNPKHVWSLLLFCGYLSLTATPQVGIPVQLRIPNMEVAELYRLFVQSWFDQTLTDPHYHLLLTSLIQGQIDTFSKLFKKFLLSAFSFFDVSLEAPEQLYHVFVLGVIIGLQDRYDIRSNRESGLGRYDVMLIPKNSQELGVVIEFKTCTDKNLEECASSALEQIEKRKYDLELKERKVKRILHLGMAFKGKEVVILSKLS